MPKLVKVKIENKEIYMEIEVPEDKSGSEVLAGAFEKIKEIEFEKVTYTISSFCDGLMKSIKEPYKEKKLKEISVEFGLNIGIEGGALTSYIVKGSGNASVKVKVKWEM